MKYKYVDVVRGIAILGVLAVHCNQHFSTSTSSTLFSTIISSGSCGVQLFFIASAFTLFLSMDKRSINDKYPILFFSIRRFFRIAPLYYLGILYYLFQDGFGARHWLGDATGISISNILSNVFFVHGFNPYFINSLVPGGWSIAVEMMFYAIIPLLFRWIKNIDQAYIFILISLFIKLVADYFMYKVCFISDVVLWREFIGIYFPSQLCVFSLGVFYYYFAIKENYRLKVNSNMILVSAFVILAYMYGIPIISGQFIFGISFIMIITFLSKSRNSYIENFLICEIGKCSFSMYISHFAILFWMVKFNVFNILHANSKLTSILYFIISYCILLTITLLISIVLNRFIEQPMQNVGNKLIKKLNY